MDIQFFNSRTRSLERFEPLKAGKVGLYTCGPTVYGYAHLGNFRSFLFADGMRRTLEYLGYASLHVMNITDVGHLTNDADEGEDKVELAARREGKTAWEIASFYTDAFLADAAQLNILKPHILPRATAHIPEQIALIEQLEAKGYTYQTSDGVYFDTSKFDGYGPMSGQPIEDLLVGARVETNPAKRHPADFALWKFSEDRGQRTEDRSDRPSSVVRPPSSERRQMEWNSPWGVGFPGWHIECSAMSTKYLGQPFDIHTGGIDHLFPHHTDEIAQSEAAAGVPLAQYWLHGEFMTVDGAKMAKSLGNTYTLQDAIDRGYEPLAFRYLTAGTHYRKSINFTWEALHAAQQGLQNLRSIVQGLPNPSADSSEVNSPSSSEVSAGTHVVSFLDGGDAGPLPLFDVDPDLEQDFRAKIADDLGLPQALALLWEVLKSDRSDEQKAAAVAAWDRVLGLGLAAELGKQEDIPADVESIVQQREQARQAGDYSKADALRKQLDEAGYTVRDTSDGPVVTTNDHPTDL